MVEVRVFRDSQKVIYGFQISGHASFAKRGKDIVCAAISAIAENTINSIETFTSDPVEIEAVNEKEGFLHFRLGAVSKESGLLMDSFLLGMKQIAESYERNVKLEVEED